jgi:hypothetical protein
MDKEDNLTIYDININYRCYESLPCQHYVSIKGKPSKHMDALEIAKLHEDNNLQVPKHFEKYKTRKQVRFEDTVKSENTETSKSCCIIM